MAFFNQPSLIIHEESGHLYNFAYRNNQITYNHFQKERRKIKEKIINHKATKDFDGGINSYGEIYLICRNIDNRIILLSSHRDYTHSRLIVEGEKNAENLSACVVGDDIHIFYLTPLDREHKKYRINHCYDLGDGWINQELDTINKIDLLNPIHSTVIGDEIYLLYYDVILGLEQIFIKAYNLKSKVWSDSIQLTIGGNRKLYLDGLIRENGKIQLAYCEYIEGNLIVKYQEYKIDGNNYKKIKEKDISNPGNCQFPTLIYHGKVLWICWVEYNYVASRYSEDNGNTWSDAYLWNESKTEDIVRHKYISNINNNILNYSFGNAYNLSFIGFGNLKNTKIIPIKRKGLDNKVDIDRELSIDKEENIKLWDRLSKLERDIILLRNQIMIPSEKVRFLEEEIKSLTQNQNTEKFVEERDFSNIEKRLLKIESFLLQNTRGFKSFKINK